MLRLSHRSGALAGAPSRVLDAAVMLSLLTLAACSGDATTGLLPSDPTTSRAPSATAAPANILAGARLWVDPASNAQRTADAWASTRPDDADMMDRIASAPQARWFGNWNANIRADVNAATTTITNAGAVPVFVAYNIPQRDCGGLSGGNTTAPDGYRAWVRAFANGIGGRRATVILEPDALASMDCLNPADAQLRLDLLRYAVQTLRASPRTAVYIDAGNPRWQEPATMSARLRGAGVALAQGFALNVSNYIATDDNVRYGQAIAAITDGKHFIVDTGRNGLGPAADGEWCNAAGRALGDWPTTRTGLAYVDAFLWVKPPGESDGACSGAPAAGSWMPEYALGLAQRARY